MAVTAIHPGEHLAEELSELGMSAAELARRLDVPTNRVTGILNGQRAITGDTALRLAHFFGTSAAFWLNLQGLYELGGVLIWLIAGLLCIAVCLFLKYGAAGFTGKLATKALRGEFTQGPNMGKVAVNTNIQAVAVEGLSLFGSEWPTSKINQHRDVREKSGIGPKFDSASGCRTPLQNDSAVWQGQWKCCCIFDFQRDVQVGIGKAVRLVPFVWNHPTAPLTVFHPLPHLTLLQVDHGNLELILLLHNSNLPTHEFGLAFNMPRLLLQPIQSAERDPDAYDTNNGEDHIRKVARRNQRIEITARWVCMPIFIVLGCCLIYGAGLPGNSRWTGFGRIVLLVLGYLLLSLGFGCLVLPLYWQPSQPKGHANNQRNPHGLTVSQQLLPSMLALGRSLVSRNDLKFGLVVDYSYSEAVLRPMFLPELIAVDHADKNPP